MPTYTCAVLTVSDKGSRNERQDTSGPALCEMLLAQGYTVAAQSMVPDRIEAIQGAVRLWIDEQGIDLVVSTGGTGVAPTDVTPEAVRPLFDKEVPGMAEAMRQQSLMKTPHAMLSRGVAGIRGKGLIITLPGSQRAATENLAVVLPALHHAIAKIKGDPADCAEQSA
ncbi:MAG: MogA/MoaB family molybdenum cofactor biosynthesis protein [Thermodesulfobacteriota bacterium]